MPPARLDGVVGAADTAPKMAKTDGKIYWGRILGSTGRVIISASYR